MDSVILISLLFSLILPSIEQRVSISTRIGRIVGTAMNISFDGVPYTVTEFLGIPYAEPPIGPRRFRKPVKKAAFTGTYIADFAKPMCFQNLEYYRSIYGGLISHVNIRESEDCLYLNLFLPGTGQAFPRNKLPVMIWIHGDGFQYGQQDIYSAFSFVALNGVILVTMNYRQSVFGFFSDPKMGFSGNYGLWDQQMAINWVHANIDFFGGDNTNVTLFGQGSGATSVIYQAFHGRNKTMFQRIIAESGAVDLRLSHKQTSSDFVKRSGCLQPVSSTTAACLRRLPFDRFARIVHNDTFYPVYDRDFLKINPRDVIFNKTNAGWEVLKRFGELDFIFGVNTADGGNVYHMVHREINIFHQYLSAGTSLDIFQNFIIPFILKRHGIPQTEVLTHAIMNKYVDWISPYDTNEMTLKEVDFMSDIEVNADSLRTADAHSSSNKTGRLFFYVFDYQNSIQTARFDSYKGANRGDEIPFVLGFSTSGASDPAQYNSAHDIMFSRQLMEYWTNFAKTGDPNMGWNGPSALTHWPEYDKDSQLYIRFCGNVSHFPVEDHYIADRIHFWNTLVPVLIDNCKMVCHPCHGQTVSPVIIG